MMDSYRGSSILVAASNHEGMLDRALWRRFEEVLFFVLRKECLLDAPCNDAPDGAEVSANAIGLGDEDFKDVFIASVTTEEVEASDDALCLTEAVDAAVALLHAAGIPRGLEVDQSGARLLEVEPLTGGICGEQEAWSVGSGEVVNGLTSLVG